MNVTIYPKEPLRCHIHGYRSKSVDSFELAALADFAVLVSGQRLDDEVARIPGGHGPALGMVIADSRHTDIIVMAVVGIERQSDSRRAVDAWCGVLDARSNPDANTALGVSAPGADTIDTGNAEYMDMAGRRRRWPGAEGKHGEARSDDGNAAQHGRIPCSELFRQKT